MTPDSNELFITVITPDHMMHKIPALAGWSVMEIIRDAGLPGLKAECGGALACATCHVYVTEPWAARINPASIEEHDMIADHAIEVFPTSRLSCQILMRDDLNGMTVTIAPNPD